VVRNSGLELILTKKSKSVQESISHLLWYGPLLPGTVHGAQYKLLLLQAAGGKERERDGGGVEEGEENHKQISNSLSDPQADGPTCVGS
jgi:hypothetical protein